MVEQLQRWTIGGRFFGFRDGDDLWTHDGRHVGRFSAEEVYAPDGGYLGELSNGQLVTDLSKVSTSHERPEFDPYADRASIPNAREFDRDAIAPPNGYGEFPGPDEL